MVFQEFLSVLTIYILSSWRPKFIFDLNAVKDLWSYSYNLTGSLFINYFIRNSDKFIIGKVIGSEGLGIYSRAYDLMLLPLNLVGQIMGRVMMPVLSKFKMIKYELKKFF